MFSFGALLKLCCVVLTVVVGVYVFVYYMLHVLFRSLVEVTGHRCRRRARDLVEPGLEESTVAITIIIIIIIFTLIITNNDS